MYLTAAQLCILSLSEIRISLGLDPQPFQRKPRGVLPSTHNSQSATRSIRMPSR